MRGCVHSAEQTAATQGVSVTLHCVGSSVFWVVCLLSSCSVPPSPKFFLLPCSLLNVLFLLLFVLF